MKAVGMGERTGSKVRSRGHQRATGGSALIPPPLHQSEYSHPRLGLFRLLLSRFIMFHVNLIFLSN